MRRREKEITDENVINEILLGNMVCRVGLIDGDRPYIIPMNYGYANNAIYIHSANEGKKVDLIKKNNNVCVEVTDSVEIITSEKACAFGTRYRCVICKGKLNPIVDLKEKVEALNIIMKQHTGSAEWNIPEKATESLLVMKIEISEITGKSSGM